MQSLQLWESEITFLCLWFHDQGILAVLCCAAQTPSKSVCGDSSMWLSWSVGWTVCSPHDSSSGISSCHLTLRIIVRLGQATNTPQSVCLWDQGEISE